MLDAQPIAVTIPRAVLLSGLGRSVVYTLIADGTLKAVKAGRRTLVLTDSLRNYVESLPPVTIRAPKAAA